MLASSRMRVVDLIRRKRDSGELSAEEIKFLIEGYTHARIPDYQMAAWLMAAWIRGLSAAELAALTEAMLYSGKVLDWSELPGRKVDKHSTGGVGDKTSMIIAPIAAAGGLIVPMISGRGLGHTGGTLDKLESISGFNVNLSLAQFREALAKCGCGLIGQTEEIAPADKKIYALRDVTGTVDNPFLICASIMSKKLAEGIDALVLDVKTGSGAFMKKNSDAEYLAGLMVETGKRMGKKIVALITDMDQPLGRTAGNAMEIAECIEVLGGGGPADLRELCIELSGWMFFLGEKSASVAEGRKLADQMITSGRARDKFREIISQQSGDARVVDEPRRLPQARSKLDVTSGTVGFITAIDCERLGIACGVLGGGREKKEDTIDPAVGLEFHCRLGDKIERGARLATLHYNSDARLAEARQLVESSYKVAGQSPAPRPLIHKVIGA
jgi:pyrimidine-nucleoside phosphorylase